MCGGHSWLSLLCVTVWMCFPLCLSLCFCPFYWVKNKQILNGRGSESFLDCSHHCSWANHSISHRFRDHDGLPTYAVVPPSKGNSNCAMVTLLWCSYYADNGGSWALEVAASFPIIINGSLCCEMHMCIHTHTWTHTDTLKTCAILLTQLCCQEKTKISLCCLRPSRGNQPPYCLLPSMIFRLVFLLTPAVVLGSWSCSLYGGRECLRGTKGREISPQAADSVLSPLSV